MPMRLSACSIVCAALLAVSASAEAGPKGADVTAAPPDRALVLNLRLVSADRLPLLSRIEFLREMNAIWRDANVRLNWLNGSEPDREDVLRVMVSPTSAGSTTRDHCLVVGELLKYEDDHAMAVVSLAAAERVLADSHRSQFPGAAADYDRRLGVALGRAAAHEVGHYLLHTSSHAASGLMRANFLADEIADAATDTFSLDDEAREHLQLAGAAGPAHWIDRSRDAAFSYGSASSGFTTLEVLSTGTR